MFVLLTSISQYISEIVLFSEYEIMTGRLVNTKLLGFRLLWDVTVYVIDRQNCPTDGGGGPTKCPRPSTRGIFQGVLRNSFSMVLIDQSAFSPHSPSDSPCKFLSEGL